MRLFLILFCGLTNLKFADAVTDSPELQALGAQIFSDQQMSKPTGQSCFSCHNANNAFSDPRTFASSIGADALHFGNRNAPSLMYLKFVPALHQEKNDEGGMDEIGGLFWDGRANSLEEQASGPLFNPIEMATTREDVTKQVCTSATYASSIQKIFGASACDLVSLENLNHKIETAFEGVTEAIASFERTNQFSPFSSKFDRVMANQDKFTETEQRGYDQFTNTKTANCVGCHVLDKENSAQLPLFTDFSYDNLGIPQNPEILARGYTAIDIGLQSTTKNPDDRGRFRVPTLRNIAKTAPYGHNGYFKTLYQMVDFYNTRDTKPACATLMSSDDAEKNNCWPVAEVPETVNHEELGNLKLSEQDVQDLVAFMNTLSD